MQSGRGRHALLLLLLLSTIVVMDLPLPSAASPAYPTTKGRQLDELRRGIDGEEYSVGMVEDDDALRPC